MLNTTPIATVRAKYLRYIAQMIATDDTRYYLTGILIEPYEDGVLLVATDGHVLGACQDEQGTATAAGIWPITPSLLVAINERRPETFDEDGDSEGPGDFLIDGNSLVLFCDPLVIVRQPEQGPVQGDQFFSSHKINGKFPEWRKVIPASSSDGYAIFVLNPSKVCQFEPVACGGGLHFTKTEEDGAIVIRSYAVPEFYGLLMLMRIDEISETPPWAVKVQLAKGAQA